MPAAGQSWTSLSLESAKQKNVFEQDPTNENIWFITTEPKLGIGERCFLLLTPTGNILWDRKQTQCLASFFTLPPNSTKCYQVVSQGFHNTMHTLDIWLYCTTNFPILVISFIDQPTLDFIASKGGLKSIVISHPHFYTTHLEWAHQFNCPVYTTKADEEWLNRKDPYGLRKLIEGTTEISEGVTAIQCGGHFDGSLILHWEGSIFIADTMMSVPVSFDAVLACPLATHFSDHCLLL